MSDRNFNRCQRTGSFLYALMLSLCALGFIPFSVLVFINISASTSLEDILIMSGILAFFALGFVFAGIKMGRPSKRARDRYKQLSDAEKAEVNSELNVRPKQQQLLFGAKRLYFYSDLFLFFMDYNDIAWMYQTVNTVPVVIGAGGMVLESSADYQGLVIYDRDGQRYKSPARICNLIVEELKEKSPGVIIGYSKEKKRLARTDFDRFLVEWGDK